DDVKKGQTLFTIGRPRSPAGRVHSDRGRGRAAIDHPQSGAASRALLELRSANSTRLRPTSRPRRQSAGGVASKRRAYPAPFVGATRPPPVSALEMSFALAAAS